MNQHFTQLKEFIDEIAVIDTHEHQIEETERLTWNLDFGVLMFVYNNCCLVSAGMPAEDVSKLISQGGDPVDKWRLLEPYYDFVKHTDYFRSYRYSMEACYGISDLNEETCVELTRRIMEANKPGIVRKLIRDKARVDLCIVNSRAEDMFDEARDRDLFIYEIGFGSLFAPHEYPWKTLQEKSGIALNSFNDLLNIASWFMEKYSDVAPSIKIQSAYCRTLFFTDPDKNQAIKAFEKFQKNPEEATPETWMVWQDYLMHHIIRGSIENDLSLRLHTGYLAGNNSMKVYTVNPTLLSDVLIQYPEARFSLFHMGYPYQDEMVALVKHFSNVTADMCWAWILDARAAKNFLKQCIHAVPVNKIFGFGGDFVMAESIAGHCRIAREGISMALSEMVDDEILNLQDAKMISQRILRDNPIEYFKL